MKSKAVENRNQVVEILKKLQQEHPEFFGSQEMIFKRQEAIGIATVPGLAQGDSFTDHLSKAVARGLAKTSEPTTKEQLREMIVQEFFEKS